MPTEGTRCHLTDVRRGGSLGHGPHRAESVGFVHRDARTPGRPQMDGGSGPPRLHSSWSAMPTAITRSIPSTPAHAGTSMSVPETPGLRRSRRRRLARRRLLRSVGSIAVTLATASLTLVALARPAEGQSRLGNEWTWPVAAPVRIAAGFRPPAHPWLPGHRGVDLATKRGDAVFAAGPGLVAFAGHIAGKGVVVVLHRNGLRTTYEPVNPLVSPGDYVNVGQPLGHMEAGLSHCGINPWCLHWGLRRGLSYLNPLSLVWDLRPILLPVDDVGPWSAPGFGPSPTEFFVLADTSSTHPANSAVASGATAKRHSRTETGSNLAPAFVVGSGATAVGAFGLGISRRLRRGRVRSSSSH